MISLVRWLFLAAALAALMVGCASPNFSPELTTERVASAPNTPAATPPPVGAQTAAQAVAQAVTQAAIQATDKLDAPAAPREFRAAWVATVANIDWPSRSGLPAAQQQAEMHAMLDKARAVGLNAIVLQVRTAADALYPSALEPWSEWLSGEQGRAPEPAYDPLALWVREAHKRGLELHAWFNPYRVRHSGAKSPASASHVSRARAELVRAYGEQLWFDPGEAAAAAQTLAVVADVVKRYDIDGVHIDDYFYPYPVKGAEGVDLPFPDDAPWQRYISSGGKLGRDDWRRDNVNRLVQALHTTVRSLKPQVRFGISPFGLGRPDLRPAGIEGFSQYDKLYADVELWVQRGWLDYLAPQLYWAIDSPGQPFAPLLDYWAARMAVADGGAKHLWPGLFTSSIASGTRQWRADEVLAQVGLVRARSLASGHIHFSMRALMEDRDGIGTRLMQPGAPSGAGPYAQAALAPATPWLDKRQPSAPRLLLGQRQVTLLSGDAEPPFVWAVWQRNAGHWRFDTLPGHVSSLAFPSRAGLARADEWVISAVSRTGQESQRVQLRMAPP